MRLITESRRPFQIMQSPLSLGLPRFRQYLSKPEKSASPAILRLCDVRLSGTNRGPSGDRPEKGELTEGPGIRPDQR